MGICRHNKFGTQFIQKTIQLRKIIMKANKANIEDLSSTGIKQTVDI